jgi:hypothetical protein
VFAPPICTSTAVRLFADDALAMTNNYPSVALAVPAYLR